MPSLPPPGPGSDSPPPWRPGSAGRQVWLIADGPDPDNYAAVLAAISSRFRLPLAGVVMTGRPVSNDPSARPYQADPARSAVVRRTTAIRVKDLLVRLGRPDIPVYEGGIAPYSTIPHRIHLDERIYDDGPPRAESRPAGGLSDAVERLASLPAGTTVDLICAGPFTDVVALMNDPRINGRLGLLTAQAGMFGSQEVVTMSGGRRQFNVLADSDAAREVFGRYPGVVCVVPTDITKLPEFSFTGPGDLAAYARSAGFAALAQLYERAWPVMWEPRDERIFVHDFHPVELMADLAAETPDLTGLEPRRVGRHTLSRVTVTGVPSPGPDNDWTEEARWGEIDLADRVDPSGPVRFLVTAVERDRQRHREKLADVLNAPVSGPAVR